jgi:hypothetical protein
MYFKKLMYSMEYCGSEVELMTNVISVLPFNDCGVETGM